MSHVEMWALLGIGRISALAKQLGVSRQYVSKKIGSLNTNEVLIAINNIEQYEMRSERCIKNNIMSAAKHVKSKMMLCEIGLILHWLRGQKFILILLIINDECCVIGEIYERVFNKK